jgi:hypothetical protein
MNYGKEWVGRYFTQKLTLITATLNRDCISGEGLLSIGAGFSVNYVLLSETVGVNNLGSGRRMASAQSRWRLAATPECCWPVHGCDGLTYRSQVDTSYTDGFASPGRAGITAGLNASGRDGGRRSILRTRRRS